jgi:hypothetical protein
VNEISWGTLAVLALTAAVSPFSLIAFSLVLATDRGVKNGVAFIAGWMTMVMLIGIAGLLLGNSMDVSQSGSTSGEVTLGIEIALGVVLLTMWVRRRLRGPVERVVTIEQDEPGWKRRITSMKSPGAFVLGAAVQTWPVMLAGVAEITRGGLGDGEAIAVTFLFALGTVTGVVILEILAFRSPGSAAARLDRIQNYVDSHRDTVISWIMLGGGIWLLGRGVVGLVV